MDDPTLAERGQLSRLNLESFSEIEQHAAKSRESLIKIKKETSKYCWDRSHPPDSSNAIRFEATTKEQN